MALIDKNGKSHIDNVRKVDWAQRDTGEELMELTHNVENSFYTENVSEQTVTFKKNLVKEYLESIKGRTAEGLKEKRTAAWIMAVQIALEFLGYDVGYIDGILSSRKQVESGVMSNTKSAVKKFQEDYKLTENNGFPGPETISKLIELLEGVESSSEIKEEVSETDQEKLDKVEVNEGFELGGREIGEVEAKELLKNLPEGAEAKYKDKEKLEEGEVEIEITLGEATRTIKVKVEIKESKTLVVTEIKEEVSETDQEKLDKVEVNEGFELGGREIGEVEAKELLKNLPEGAEAKYKDKEKLEEGEVEIEITLGEATRTIKVKVEIKESKTLVVTEIKEEVSETDQEKLDKVEVNEGFELGGREIGEVEAKELLKNLPEGAEAKYKDKEKLEEGEVEIEITLGEATRTIKVKVEIKESKTLVVTEIKEEVSETDQEKLDKVEVNEGFELGGREIGEVEAKELLKNLPEGAEAKYKDKEKLEEGEVEIEITLGEATRTIKVKVEIKESKTLVVTEIKEEVSETDQEKLDKVEVNEGFELGGREIGEVEAKELLKNLPEGAEAKYKDKEKLEEGEVEIEITLGEATRTIKVKVEIKESKTLVVTEIKEEVSETDQEKLDKVEVNEGFELGGREIGEVEAKELLKNLPEGAEAKYKDKEKLEEGEVEIEITLGEATRTIKVKVEIKESKTLVVTEIKEEVSETDQEKLDKVEVNEGFELGGREIGEVEAKELLKNLPEGAEAKYKDKEKLEEGEVEIEITLGEATRTIKVKVEIKESKTLVVTEIKEEVSETDQEKLDKVEVNEGFELGGREIGEVEAKELLKNLPEGAEAKYKDKEKLEEGEVEIEITLGEATRTIKVKVEIKESKTLVVTEIKEEVSETDQEKLDKVEVNEGFELGGREIGEVEAKELLKNLPEGAEAKYKDKEKLEEGEVEIEITLGEATRTIKVKVEIKESKTLVVTEIKEEVSETDQEKLDKVEVKEEIALPAENEEVKPEALLDGLPQEGVTVEFKDGKGIDKEIHEKQTVTVVVKIGDKEKEFIIVAKIEGDKIILEDKEKKELKEWLEKLEVDDLGEWDRNSNFIFKDGLIDSETGVLEIKDDNKGIDKRIDKIEDGGEGFGYMVKEKSLCIGNFENGVLNGNGIEFQSYLAPYQMIENEGAAQIYGIKSQGEWNNGELNNGVKDVYHANLHVYLDIKEGKADKCYIDDETISFDLENQEDGLYAVNGDKTLKLDKELSAVRIMYILDKYNGKKGEFGVKESPEDYNTKILYRKEEGSDEYEEVMGNLQDSIESELDTEAWDLANWLNEYRETHKKFELEDYGAFNSDGKFEFKAEMVYEDEDGKSFIEYNGERYYEYQDGMSGLGYQNDIESGSLYVGNFVDGSRNGKGICVWSDGDRFEGEFKDGGVQKGKCTIESTENMKGEYDVERDEKGLRIVSGDNEGKYLGWDEDEQQYIIENREEVGINLEEYGSFNSDGNFEFKDGVVQEEDESGKKFIEYNNKKYYEYQDGMNDLGYQAINGHLFIGNLVDGEEEGKGILVRSSGARYEGNFKNAKKHGRGIYVWSDGDRFEGEFKDDKMKKGKLTIESTESIKGEYEIEMDEKGKRIVSGDNEGKYLVWNEDNKQWTIEDIGSSEDDEGSSEDGEGSDEDDEGSDEDNVEDISQGDFDALCEKTSLTVDEAKKLVKFANGNNKSLDLKLTSIDKDVAAELAKSKGENLYLNGLTSIDKDIAAELAKSKGENLYLNGLTSIDKDIAAELAKYKGVLYLRGLTSITDDVARELAKQPGTLILPGSILTDEQNNILRGIA